MKALLFLGIPLFFLSTLYATPKGFNSTNATYQVDANGAHIITSGQRGLVHWEHFSLSRGELARFQQKNAHSVILNHVTGNSVSKIYGRLESNGKVILLNRSGVVIGPEGSIECAGFLASTATIPEDVFLRGGDLLFKDYGEGAIINLGTIHCPTGDVIMLARSVTNSGLITANNIYLASGTEVLLKPDGPIFIRSSIDAVSDKENPYSLAVKSDGKIVAQKIEQEGGKIFLISEEGQTVVNGPLLSSAGTIHVTGQEVLIHEHAFIDVSSPHQAGEVLIGGDMQGKNPDFKNAQFTTTKQGSEIHADSTLNGNGGKIILWSDQDTVCNSEITATARDGNAGFVEVSGKKSVAISTHPDLRSKYGRWGTFLLDAGPITIDHSNSSGPTTYGDSYISTQLGLVQTFTLDTGSEPAGTETITIDSAADISWSAPSTLELIAGRNIVMQNGAMIESTNSGATPFTALSMEGKGNASGANWEGISIAGTLKTNRGSISLTGTGGDTGSTNDGILLSGGEISSANGSIILEGFGNGPNAAQNNNRGIVISNSSKITTNDTGSISLTGYGYDNPIGANGNNGILLDSSSEISSSTGSITFVGYGQGMGAQNIGIIVRNSNISTVSGLISLTGNGSDDSVGIGVHGMRIDSGATLSSGSGKITLTGMGGIKGGFNCDGILISDTDTAISTSTGDISMHGTAGGNEDSGGGASDGISLTGFSSIMSDTGTISLTGFGGENPGLGNHGLRINSNANISTTSGEIILQGTAGTNGSITCIGIQHFDSNISSTSGKISLTGVGGGKSLAQGILIQNSTIKSTSNNVTLTGTGSDGGSLGNQGVRINNNGIVSSETGNVTIFGTGGALGFNHIGIVLAGGEVSNDSGNIELTGIGRGGNSGNHGMNISSGSTVHTTSGSIALTGKGSSDGSGSHGINVAGDIASSSGKILVSGTAQASGNNNAGVRIISGGTISSDSNTVTIIGRGAETGNNNNFGVLIDGLSTSVSGQLTLTGYGSGTGNNNSGIQISNTASVSCLPFSQSNFFGSAGDTGNNSHGILIADSGTQLTATNCPLSLIGASGAGTDNGITVSRATVTDNRSITMQAFSDIVLSEGAVVSSPQSVSLTAARDISIQGGNLVAINTEVSAGGDLSLIAGRNLSLVNGLLSLPVATAGNNMTCVVDNLFPTFPSRGPGTFQIESMALLTAGGEMRIYTVQPSQNTISAPLNGSTFTAGTFGVDTNTEKWVLYYSDGSYGGPDFTIYYKVGNYASGGIGTSRAISQLSSLVPIIQFSQLPPPGFTSTSPYHGEICPCKVEFDPYRAFIFEDDIYWTSN